MDELVKQLLKSNVVDVGEVKISQTSLGKKRGPRYLIYLPTTRNYLWQMLHASGHRVRVFIEIPADVAPREAKPA
jgi:hypothetical protein